MKSHWFCIISVPAILAPDSFSQDTSYVYRYPSSDQFVESVHGTVTRVLDELRFSYKISNEAGSDQSIWAFGVATQTPVENLESPPTWVVLPGKIDPETFGVPWWAKDSTGFIHPNSQVEGFSFLSRGLPSIGDYSARGWVELPNADVEPDSTIGGEEWRKGKSGSTVVPIDPPMPFVPTEFLDTLSSYVTRSTILGWINDQQVAQKYVSYFATAIGNIENNDLTSARTGLLHVLQEATADSATYLSDEAYALVRYNTEYLLGQLPLGNGISTYSVFSTHSTWLEQNSSTLSGDIGVNVAGSAPFLNSEVELAIGIGTSIAPGYSVKANQIKVKQGATVAGDVYYNTLDNNGTISGSLHTPLSLPLVATLPEFKNASPGTQDITVPQNGSQALQPGNYRDITVKKNGVLTFTGGVYHLNSFNGGDNAQILFQGASEVRVAGKFDTDQGTYLGPQDTTTLSASQIVFYVAGINGSTGNLGATPKAAQIGIANTVKANFYVPNGTLWIRQNSQATGAFIGKDVDVGRGVTIWLKSAF